MKAFLIAIIFFLSTSVVADDEKNKPNCKLTVRTINHEGERKVKVTDEFAVSKKACKARAEELKAEEHKNASEREEVLKSVVVSAGYRESRP